jgi:hypothetical protein
MTKTSVPKLRRIKWKDGIVAHNTVTLHPRTQRDDFSVDDTLREAWMEDLESIALIGISKTGKEYIAVSRGDDHYNAYLFSRAHLHLLRERDD